MTDTPWGKPVVLVDNPDMPTEPIRFGNLGDRYIRLEEGESYPLPDGTVAVGPGTLRLKLVPMEEFVSE